MFYNGTCMPSLLVLMDLFVYVLFRGLFGAVLINIGRASNENRRRTTLSTH